MSLKEQMLNENNNLLLNSQATEHSENRPEVINDREPLRSKMETNTSVIYPRECLKVAETFVKKFYLDELNTYEVTKASRRVLELSTDRNLVLYKISGLIFNKDEKVQDRLNNVYSSMHSLNLSVVFMLQSDGREISFYIGTKTVDDKDDFQTNRELSKAFEHAFKGNFPGSEVSPVDISDFNKFLKKVLPEDGKNAVTSLTSLPSLKDDDATNDEYVQGLEKFIDAMDGQEYVVLVISDPVTGGQIEEMKRGYEELYSEIAPLGEYNLTLSENEGINISQSEMEGYSDTIGRSISKTQSFTKGKTITKSESTTNTFGIGVGMMGNVGSIGSSLFGGPVAAAAVSGLSQAIGGTLGLNASRAKQKGTSDADNESKQVGSQDTEQKSHSTMSQQTQQKGITTGSSTSSMVKYENKSVKVFLECIDDHLKRLKQCENYGMWSSAAYFISPNKETSIISASAYKGIINGEGTSLESSSMNTWFGDEETKEVNKYLRHFTHPRFHDKDYLIDYKTTADVTPSTMLSTKELSVQCSVPYKSVPGIVVKEMAEFGRNVHFVGCNSATVRIGSIYHMGEVYDKHSVEFHIDSLREHTFITGSTGSGKSNTVYEIIARLNGLEYKGKLNGEKIATPIPTLIIEPAKGEYKQVFGNDFNVFGTNSKATKLLRINPFKFENNIHILEHIDRLIDIFNVCWPMYAAMPAVLKEAVELSYSSCGWDLSTSSNPYGEIYPNFRDLLAALRKVIRSSDYSQEVKDNYTGSLITRVKSLTNGINGQIFTSFEIDNHVLFEKSTIIDLSRVGSSETKAMIMGIIVMRLQERRMSQGGMNLPLKHVTVIEEAHNLLKRTSTEQSTEGSNLLGKSVEMISNAIAEMRTHGEGFVIVDQAPGLLDMSAIRNTNTKIILHLPDMTDRELVGRAAGLNEDQLIEIAKIPSGVAAVYQNRWVEPVLCKIDYFDIIPREYSRKDIVREENTNQNYIKARISEFLISRLAGQEKSCDVEELRKWIMGADIESEIKIAVLRILSSTNKPRREKVERLVANIVDNENIAFELAKESEDIEQWNQELIDSLNISKGDLSEDSINDILECLIHYRSLEHNSDEENFYKWMNYMGRREF